MAVNDHGLSSFITTVCCSLMSVTPSALLRWKANIAHVYSSYANMSHFKRLSGWHFQKSCSLALSLSACDTVALLWPGLLHLSLCQDLSFIYRKAFTQINTAPQQLLGTYAHTPKLTCAHSLRILAYDQRQKQNTAVLGSPV